MQRAILAFAFLLLPASASLSASSEARLFLKRHEGAPPQADELAELKGQNPEAYAIVKALLTKRSLGLLNPRHPTASFSAPAADQDAAPAGPEAFEKLAGPGELSLARTHQETARSQVTLPYADVAAAAPHRDWMNWKPQNSGMSDEQMVQNVLGAVAELKGGKKAGLLAKHSSEDNALTADEASLSVEEPAKPAALTAAPQPRENSYLKSIDFGLNTQEKPAAAAPAKKDNSYLRGLDLSGDMPQVVAAPASSKKAAEVQSSSNNYLASFSWDDSKPQAPKPEVVKPAEPKVNSKDKSLMSWLGVVDKAPTPKAAPAAPAKPSNPYLMDLS